MHSEIEIYIFLCYYPSLPLYESEKGANSDSFFLYFKGKHRNTKLVRF